MCKKKAVLCTVLFIVAIIVILVLSSFCKNEEIGVDLFHIIIYITSTWWFLGLVEKFYKWLCKT